MATLQARLSDLITAIGTDYKTIWANTGNKSGLSTTDKSSLVAGINEVKTIADSAAGGGVSINDAATTSTTQTFSANKINTLDAAQTSAVALKAPIASPTFTGTVSGVTKTHVGLANVDNTADTAKPVSTAQQTALNLKANLTSPAFTGTPTGITAAHVGLGNVTNTADSAKPVSTAQQTALDLKAPLASPAFTGTPTGITKTHVGLSNVDNTTDALKPVSTAAQAALDLKAPIASPTFTGTVSGVTKTHVGLGNVDNIADASKPVSTAQATAIAALIADASATNATGTTYSANKINAAISAAVSALVGSAGATLDTLQEIATALGNDANFATTITTALGNRLRFDAAQTLTAPQKVQGKANLDALGTLELGNPDTDLVALYTTAKA